MDESHEIAILFSTFICIATFFVELIIIVYRFPYNCSASLQILLYIIHIANITSILFSAIIAFLVVMLLHLTVSRKSQNNLELAAKN